MNSNHPVRFIFGPACLAIFLFIAPLWAADWNQWRGPNRNGVAPDSPILISKLPQEGLTPVWMNKNLPAIKGSGWSSPVVSGGKVYIFAHKKQRARGAKLPPRKFPYLPPEKRQGMSPQEYAQHEKNRRDEDQSRAKAFQFQEVVYCLDAQSGQTVWTNQQDSVYTRFPQSSSPAVIDGRIYTLGAGRTAHCIEVETGTSLWRRRLPGDFRDEHLHSSFAVAEGVAVVLCGRLFGLDAQMGEILWEGDSKTTKGQQCSPVVWNNAGRASIIINVAGGRTVCLDPKTGKEHWRIKSEGGNSTPVLAVGKDDQTLLLTYGGSRKRGLRCFAISSTGAELLWKFQKVADPGSSPVVIDGHVYVQGDTRLACVDLETGKSEWMTRLDINRPRYTSLVGADSKVFYTHDGLLCFAADPTKFHRILKAQIDNAGLLAEESEFRRRLDMDRLERTAEGQKQAERLWRKTFGNSGPLPCASPAIVDGKIYIRLKNAVACYDFRKR